VGFDRVEYLIPTVAEIEERHVEHKHRVVPAALRPGCPAISDDTTQVFPSLWPVTKELKSASVNFSRLHRLSLN
jgi:hypothetical protein